MPQRKVVDYLPALSHPEDRSKAVFFRQFVFSPERWERLAEALLQHAAANDVKRVEGSPFGTRYVVEGRMQTPDGRRPYVRSVWFIDAEGRAPRFVTAYPIKKKV